MAEVEPTTNSKENVDPHARTEESQEGSYDVEAIKKWRYNKRLRRREFLIKWVGYSEADNTWEPEQHLDCPKLIKSFKNKLSKEQRRCFNSRHPSKLTGFQRNAKLVKCLGADGPHESDHEGSDKENKEQFYLLLQFDDSDAYEEMSWRDFYTSKPKEAFEFFESRLFARLA